MRSGIKAKTCFRSFHRRGRRRGLPLLASHTLRHFFISQAVMSSEVSFFTIAKWVGHLAIVRRERAHPWNVRLRLTVGRLVL